MRRFAAVVTIGILATACAETGMKAQDKVALSDQESNLYQLAQTARASGDIGTATSLYQQMISTSRGSVVAHLELASLYRQIGQPQQAADVLNQARALQPDNVAVLNALGFAYLNTKQSALAQEAFEHTLERDGSNVSALSGKGIALDLQGKHTDAQETYKKALAIKPDNVAIQNNLSLSYILDKQATQALPILEKLANAPGTNTTVRQNLALAYGVTGEANKAKAMGLRDLPVDKVEENLRFYRQYQQEKIVTAPAQMAVPVARVETEALAATEPAAGTPAKTEALMEHAPSFMLYEEGFGPAEEEESQ